MFNASKIQKFAERLTDTVYLDGIIYDELNEGLDCYGLDSGKRLLEIFTKYFKDEFLILFWSGKKENFDAAIIKFKNN